MGAPVTVASFESKWRRGMEPGDKKKPRILVVEDEPFISLMLDEMLRELGYDVAASLSRVGAALDFLDKQGIDLALLDVNLGSEKIDPVADLLAERACPFVFTTGYGQSGAPAAHADHVVLQKPFRIDDLAAALQNEFARNQA
jgi:CheY-like chemotaxis protein